MAVGVGLQWGQYEDGHTQVIVWEFFGLTLRVVYLGMVHRLHLFF